MSTVSKPGPSEDQRTIRRALVSVYDKTGLADLARGLHEAGVEIVGRVAREGITVSYGKATIP